MNALPSIDFVSSVPEPARASKSKGGSEFGKLMRSMPAPGKDGKGKDAPAKIASFFVAAAAVPTTITDPKEREKATKDAVRRVQNQFTSLARRITKEDPTFAFAFRAATDANGVAGLRVYRVVPAASATPGAQPS